MNTNPDGVIADRKEDTMRGMWAGCLGLSLGMVASLSAEETLWRPVPGKAQAAPVNQTVAALEPGSRSESPTAGVCPMSLGKPEPAVTLGRPTALNGQEEKSGRQAQMVDAQVQPASFSSTPVPPPPPVFRAAMGDGPKPLPVGPPASEPGLLRSSEENYNRGVVVEKPATAVAAGGQAPTSEVIAPTPAPGPAPTTGPAFNPGTGPVMSVPGFEPLPHPSDCGSCAGGHGELGGECGSCGGESCPCGDGCSPVCCGDGSCCHDPTLCCGPDGLLGNRLWVRGEYLMWWTKKMWTPPLVTTGSLTDAVPGALGQPGTTVLFGGSVNTPNRDGGRFTIGYWFDRDETWGIEGNYLFLSQRSASFEAGSNGMLGGTTLVARPFFLINPPAGTPAGEAAQLVSNTFIPGLPGVPVTNGSVLVNATTNFWGAELNGLYCLSRGNILEVDLLAGFRYLQLNESLGISENITIPMFVDPTTQAVSPFSGSQFFVSDSFKTRNQFYGEQVGARAKLTWGNFDFVATGKVAVGLTHQVVEIHGLTTTSNPLMGIASTTQPGGLLAQQSNIGNYSRDKFAVVPEMGLTVGYQLTPHIKALAGYNFIYWSSVVRPGNQIDRTVNASLLPGSPVPASGAPRPAFAFNGTDYFAHGVNFGLEFDY